MSKAILVMDMPSNCIDCRFCREIDDGVNACCEIVNEPNDNELCRTIDVSYPQEKPDRCPLKPMPEKKQHTLYSIGAWNSGYNACIDDILKGSVENE